MGPYLSQRALKNLKEGIKKVKDNMSPAARVRQQFRVGRPVKGALPLHPLVVWAKATSALADLKQRMVAAGLRAQDVDSKIVGIHGKHPDTPVFISLDNQERAIKILSRPDVIGIGMVYRQLDSSTKKWTTFSMNLAGLNEHGMGVLKAAVEIAHGTTKKVGN